MLQARAVSTLALTTAVSGAVVALPPLSTSAEAAVRRCGPVLSSGVATGRTEIEAKTKAMAEWRALALTHGPGFDSWRLATDKVLKCLPASGGFECIAMAAPCLIDQTPGSPLKPPTSKI